jgi:hypothetical protein
MTSISNSQRRMQLMKPVRAARRLRFMQLRVNNNEKLRLTARAEHRLDPGTWRRYFLTNSIETPIVLSSIAVANLLSLDAMFVPAAVNFRRALRGGKNWAEILHITPFEPQQPWIQVTGGWPPVGKSPCT